MATNWLKVSGTNQWGTSANWSSGVPNSISAIANFTTVASSNQTVNVSSVRLVNQINFGDIKNTITLSGSVLRLDGTSPKITSSNTSQVTITSAIILASDTEINISAGCTLLISGAISGSNVLTVTGAGTLILTNTNNTYDETTINSGSIVQLGNGGSFGTFGRCTVTSQGIIKFNPGSNSTISSSTPPNINISGSTKMMNLSSNTVTVNCPIGTSGTNNLTIDSPGTGAIIFNTTNTYGGTTTISNGTLQIGNGGSTGNIPSGNISISGTLSINLSSNLNLTNAMILIGTGSLNITGTQTLSGIISGTGNFSKSGTGTLILTGTNTYSGSTNVNAGVLQIGNNGSTGSINSGSVVNNSGTLIINRNTNINFANNIVTNNCSLSSNIGTQTLSGIISGTGTVTKIDTGVLILTGTNTYTGNTTISGGLLQLGNGGASGSLNATGSITNNSGCTLKINRSTTQTIANNIISDNGSFSCTSGTHIFSGIISGTGTQKVNKIDSGSMILTGSCTYTGNTLITGGTFQIGNGGSSGSLNSSGTIQNKSGCTFKISRSTNIGCSNNIDTDDGNFSADTNVQTFNGNITGTGSQNFTKTDSGTLILNGTCSHTGTTTITSGTLCLGNGGTTGSMSSSSIIVNKTGCTFKIDRSTDINFANNITTDNGNFSCSSGTQTFSGTISGTLTQILNKVDSGTMIITGNCTNTGNTNINGGTFCIGNGGSTGSISSSSPVVNNSGCTFKINRNTDINLTNNITCNNGNISCGSGSQTCSGVISGTIVNKTESGILKITGNCTYTGNTNINGGTFCIGNGSSIGTISSVSNIITNSGCTFKIDRNTDINFSNNISTDNGNFSCGSGTQSYTSPITGFGSQKCNKTESGTLKLKAACTHTGQTQISSGTLHLEGSGSCNNTSNYLNNGNLVISKLTTLTISVPITGTGSLSNISTGTLILTANNTYSGSTTISSGKLKINSPGSISSTTTATNSQLQGLNGTYGPIILGSGGVLLAGDETTVGVLTINGNLTCNSGSSYNWKIFGNSENPSDFGILYDGCNINGSLIISPTNGCILNVFMFGGPLGSIDMSNVFWNTGSPTIHRNWNCLKTTIPGTNTGTCAATNAGGSVTYIGTGIPYNPAYGYFITLRLVNGYLQIQWNFLSGTCIHPDMIVITPNGEKKICQLKNGDLVWTNENKFVPILELVYNVHQHTKFVRCQANSISENVPDRELLVTSGHKLLHNGEIVKILTLTNGNTIKRIKCCANTYTIITEDGNFIMVNNTPLVSWNRIEWNEKLCGLR